MDTNAIYPDPVEFPIGEEDLLCRLFAYDFSTNFNYFMSHWIRQSLQLDGVVGSWVQVYFNNTDHQYYVKMAAPNQDLSSYRQILQRFIAAGATALATFEQRGLLARGLQFMMPVGLPLQAYRSVFLLHYPPTEAGQFSDYIYSNTNGRWESLLGLNHVQCNPVLLERMVDILPLLADGGAGSRLENYTLYFVDYVREQVSNFLSHNAQDGFTVPLVIGGIPALQAFQQAFANQLADFSEHYSPEMPVTHTFSAELVQGFQTPIIYANHPSEFLFAMDESDEETRAKGYESARDVLREDLICAGWQVEMAKDPSRDPLAIRDSVEAYWTDERVASVMRQQKMEFGYPDYTIVA